MRGRPLGLVRDVLPAVALLALGVIELATAGDVESPGLVVVLLAAITIPLAVRRWVPLLVMAWALVMAAVSSGASDQSLAAYPLAMLLAIFTAGHELERPRAYVAAGLTAAFISAGIAIDGGSANDMAFAVVTFGGAWAFGSAMRVRGQRVARLTERTHELEAERDERERAAAEAERARIARELHDIVSHSISAVVIRTQALRRRLADERAEDRDELAAIETTARQALTEMRRLFGVMRSSGAVSLEPQPGLSELDDLLEQTRAAGTGVDVRVEGDRIPLPPGIDLAAYRIIQEALTNVRKHTIDPIALVALRFGQAELEITIENHGTPAANGHEPGYGLVGMRERVTVYGGTLDAASLPGGGFRVHARLPLRETT